jgi:hypothetical protein
MLSLLYSSVVDIISQQHTTMGHEWVPTGSLERIHNHMLHSSCIVLSRSQAFTGL